MVMAAEASAGSGPKRSSTLVQTLNAPDHLNALRNLQEKDLSPVPEIGRWARGLPESELQQARDLWEAWRVEVGQGAGGSERAYGLFRLSLQIGNEVGPAERYRIWTQAAEATRHPTFHTAMAGAAASTAVRLDDLAGARHWLSECQVAHDSLLADSSHRIAAATLAVSEGDPELAVELLGRQDGEIPILLSYRAMSMAIRAHALEASGDRLAFGTAVKRLEATTEGKLTKGIIQNLPASWRVDPYRWLDSWRHGAVFGGNLRIAGAVLVLMTALLTVWAAADSIDNGAGGGDEWFRLVAVAPFLLALAAWLAVTGLRNRRIARHGMAGSATVIGKSRRAGTQRNPRYAISVEATLRDAEGKEWHVLADNVRSYGASTCDELLGKTVRVLWNPRYPSRVVVDD